MNITGSCNINKWTKNEKSGKSTKFRIPSELCFWNVAYLILCLDVLMTNFLVDKLSVI